MAPTRWSDQELFEISRVGLRRFRSVGVGLGWVESGRIGSGNDQILTDRIGPPLLIRLDPT